MKKALLLSSLLALGAVASYGTALCTNGGTLASYVALNGAGGCENGDKVFSNFFYTPNGTDPAAGNVLIGLDNQPLINQFGLQFQSNAAIWTSGFTLSYNIAIDQSQCFVLYGSGACQIVEAQGAMQGGSTPNSAALTMVLTPGATISLNASDTTQEVKQVFFSGITSTSVVITGTGLSASPTVPISTFGLDVYQTAVPEPISMSLTGLGLLGLGFFGRRRLKA